MSYTINSKTNTTNFNSQVEEAYQNIDPVFKDSPQFQSGTFSKQINGLVTLKIETINPIGCFKGRGAEYLFFKQAEKFRSGIVAASAGNFGQGLAYSAQRYNTKCTIFVPLSANSYKVKKIEALNAEVIAYGEDFDQAKGKAKRWASENGMTFVEDGLEQEITIGAGTIAYELLKKEMQYDSVLVPLGGGSLLNGIAKFIKAITPSTKVFGVCAEGAAAMALSFQNRSCIMTDTVDTIADGIAVRSPVKEVLPDLFEFVDDVLLVTDEQMKTAIKTLFNVHRLLVEPAGVVGLAALLVDQERFSGQRVAIPLCGANLTDKQIKDWID